MSRPRATQETANAAFVKEVKLRRVLCDMTQRELAGVVGVVPSSMSALLSNPDKLSAGRLRSMILTLGLDPVIVLEFLGYTPKDIRKMRGE